MNHQILTSTWCFVTHSSLILSHRFSMTMMYYVLCCWLQGQWNIYWLAIKSNDLTISMCMTKRWLHQDTCLFSRVTSVSKLPLITSSDAQSDCLPCHWSNRPYHEEGCQQWSWLSSRHSVVTYRPTSSDVTHIEMNEKFNAHLSVDMFHAQLAHLRVGIGFNQAINPGVLPPTLKHLEFAEHGSFKPKLICAHMSETEPSVQTQNSCRCVTVTCFTHIIQRG
jgi:hypothetical protein